MLRANIPAVWRILEKDEDAQQANIEKEIDDIVKAELWVFWMEDKHTGIVDRNVFLEQLEEVKVGSFSWENIFLSEPSPTASPMSPVAKANAPPNTSLSQEYRFFVKGVRNIITLKMVQKGTIPLGDFFLYQPTSKVSAIDDIMPSEQKVDSFTTASEKTCPSCTFNLYLTSTNLVFQPVIQRLKLRSLRRTDFQPDDPKKVLLAPLSISATLKSITTDLSAKSEAAMLTDWADTLDIPVELLNKREILQANMPALVLVQLDEEVVPYPSVLVFVSTSTKATPNSIAGLDGINARNHGFIEEMSEKYSRWAWEERIAEIAIKTGAEEAFGTGSLSKSNSQKRLEGQIESGTSTLHTLPTPVEFAAQPTHSTEIEHPITSQPRFKVDFWKFTNPTAHVTSTVLKHASMPDPFGSPTLLQNAMMETLSSTLLMTPKMSRTPRRITGGYSSGELQPTLSQSWDMRRQNPKDFMTGIDLGQNPLGRKSEPEDDSYHGVSQYPYATQGGAHDFKAEELSYSGASMTDSQNKGNVDGGDLSGLQITMNEQPTSNVPGAHFQETDQNLPINVGNNEPHDESNFPSPHDHLGGGNVDLAFGMDNLGGYDQMVYGMSSGWEEGVGDLENFDLDVTEEDFDFFESTPTSKARPGTETVNNSVGRPQTSLATSSATAVTSLPANALDAPIITDLSMAVNDMDKQNNLDLDELLMATNGFLDEPLKTEPDIGIAQDIVSSEHTTVAIKSEESLDDGAILDDSLISDVKSVKASEHETGHKIEDANQLELQEDTILDADAIMPPEFAPLPVTASVNDAKYYEGGKFVYSPSKKRKKESGSTRRTAYKPDYKPSARKKMVEHVPKSQMRNKYLNEPKRIDLAISATAAIKHNYRDVNSNKMNHPPILSDGSDGSSSSSSDSSSDSSDTEMEDAEDIVRATSRLDIGADRQWWTTMNKIKTALLVWYAGGKDVKSFPIFNQAKLPISEVIDYDVPFAEIIVREPMFERPKEQHTADGHRAAVELLCQQAVLGGYPFVGNIAEISQRGGEFIDGESMQVTITRRRNLIQSNCGAVLSVPSLSDESDHLILDFKEMLNSIFDINSTSDNPEYTHLQIGQHALPTTISIKGPLNVQQYYELSDTTQTQSKYGKYQVKKRKPVEPNLDILHAPDVVVGRQEEWIEGSPHILPFWEKLRLEPYSIKKNVVYFALCPESEGLENMATNFFKELSAVYEVCLLGSHHSGVAGDHKRGVIPISLLDKLDNESTADQRMRSYRHAAQRLGATIGNLGLEGVYYVIYMINPFSHSSSYLDLSQCFQNLVVAFNTSNLGTTFSDKTRPRIVMQLIPIEHVLRPVAFGGYTKFGLKEIAFSVYSKCHVVVERSHQQSLVEDMQAVTELYAPPFILAKPPPTTIQYSIKNAYTSFPSSLEHDVTMHVAYTFSLDNRWLIAIWTDARGEMVDFMVLQIDGHLNKPDWRTNAIKDIWERTKHICGRAGFSWKFTVGKLGLMFGDELADWVTTVSNIENVAIVALDCDSPFRVSHDQESANAAESGNTPSSSSGTPTPETFTPGATPAISMNAINMSGTSKSNEVFEPETGESYALLVNHRVAYSHRRELASHGILLNRDMPLDEEWMLPLASAYLLQVPVKTSAPSREHLSLETQAVEVHLIHLQSSQTASSVLRDTVKQYHALSYLNTVSASSNCIPLHFSLADRLCRLLYAVTA
ncbi:mediator of RNA polymerase II transcription subunit 13 [Umbelopsis sp. WA50703]